MDAPSKNTYPLPEGDAARLGFSRRNLAHLDDLIHLHIDEQRFAGAQIALARHGQIALFRSYGKVSHDADAAPANGRTLFNMFSQTKMFTSAAVWTLIEEGKVSFMDRIADHLPEFASRGKDVITLHQVMVHGGGFPNANVSEASWTDHALMRKEVCDFSLEWAPGSRMHYHGSAAHLVQAMIIEAVTGRDYRHVIRERIIIPLGLSEDVFVGVPDDQDHRCVIVGGEGALVDNRPARRAAGLPGTGGFGTARGIAAFYQCLLNKGTLNGRRIFSPRLIDYVTRNHTGETPDRSEHMGNIPMHRALGPHVRGESETVRGLGTIANPATFGHGGAGSSYSWGDPASGVSFSFMSNQLAAEPWHSLRIDRISNIVHAAID